jgi:DNA-binding HxlR family transcriptional regulator
MSDELRDEMKKLKEQITAMKDQLKQMADEQRPKGRGIYIDIPTNVRDYVEDAMQGVAEGVHGELDRSIFIGPGGCRIMRQGPQHLEEPDETVNLAKVATVMSALGHEHRLKILNELMSGGRYVNELQEKLSDITTSTLSSHLNVLEEAGLVVQEKVRGRYLITIPGRTAYKMARRVTRFLDMRDEE